MVPREKSKENKNFYFLRVLYMTVDSKPIDIRFKPLLKASLPDMITSHHCLSQQLYVALHQPHKNINVIRCGFGTCRWCMETYPKQDYPNIGKLFIQMNKPFAIDTNESWCRKLLGFEKNTGLLEATKDNDTDDTYSLQLPLESTVEDIRVPITHTENRCTCGFHAVDSSTYDLEVRVGKYKHYNQTTSLTFTIIRRIKH
ncbi:MAG: hypothetical protein EOP04_18350 [Proteobacteria bacterium]|nr:MAG: hypothetical protein EOP04_18350 [Pseudomonadota bacterium]